MSIASTPTLQHPAIKSFVIRQGRMSEQRQRAAAELSPLYAINYQPQKTVLADCFARSAAPLVMEIGSGMGYTTCAIALEQPHYNFVAVEVYPAGIASLLHLIHKHQLTNLKLIAYDAVAVLQQMVYDSSLAGVHIFFPDPWHKARHHKRRLIQSPFVQMLAQKLVPDGFVHCATDWQHYFLHIQQVFNSCDHAAWQMMIESPLGERPQTKFELRGKKLGHDTYKAIYQIKK